MSESLRVTALKAAIETWRDELIRGDDDVRTQRILATAEAFEEYLRGGSPQVGDTVAYVMPGYGPGAEPTRIVGTITSTAADGMLQAEFLPEGPDWPMIITAPAEAFIRVRTEDGTPDGQPDTVEASAS
jgi:hypothetical protein